MEAVRDGNGGQVKKILNHLSLWEIKERPPPKDAGPPKVPEYSIDYSHRGVGPYGPETVSQVREPARRPSGGSDKHLYVDHQYLSEA